MKAILVLVTALWAPWPTSAGQCAGAERQLQSLSSALAREALDKAEQILDSLEQSYPNCPETLLDRGRLLALKGNATAAEDAFRSLPGTGAGCVPRLRLLCSLFVGAKTVCAR